MPRAWHGGPVPFISDQPGFVLPRTQRTCPHRHVASIAGALSSRHMQRGASSPWEHMWSYLCWRTSAQGHPSAWPGGGTRRPQARPPILGSPLALPQQKPAEQSSQ